MNCPYCGSAETEYLGVDDGGGDYGASIVDIFECGDCGQQFEAGGIEIDYIESKEQD